MSYLYSYKYTDTYQYINKCENMNDISYRQLDSLKQKTFFPVDKLLLSYRTASSGLSENVFPCNFMQKIFFIILFSLGIDVICL